MKNVVGECSRKFTAPANLPSEYTWEYIVLALGCETYFSPGSRLESARMSFYFVRFEKTDPPFSIIKRSFWGIQPLGLTYLLQVEIFEFCLHTFLRDNNDQFLGFTTPHPGCNHHHQDDITLFEADPKNP